MRENTDKKRVIDLTNFIEFNTKTLKNIHSIVNNFIDFNNLQENSGLQVKM